LKSTVKKPKPGREENKTVVGKKGGADVAGSMPANRFQPVNGNHKRKK